MTMETLSDQLAQAIANAQLFEQTRLLLDLNRSILDAVQFNDARITNIEAAKP